MPALGIVGAAERFQNAVEEWNPEKPDLRVAEGTPL